MIRTGGFGRWVSGTFLLTSVAAVAQTGVAPAASLQNIANCALDGSDVFITTGQGAEQRRYKYPWDTSIDALCNSKGFAIGTPPKPANEPPRQATPAPAPVAPPAPPPPTPTPTPPAPAAASGFPSDAAPVSGEPLRQALADKRFSVELADRSSWKLEYKANGYFFVNTSTGFNGSGTWKLQDDKLCTDGRGMNASCGAVYQRGDSLFMKRSATGEIIELRPR